MEDLNHTEYHLTSLNVNDLLQNPLDIKILFIDDEYNEDIDLTVFTNLKKLYIGDLFNQYIDFSKFQFLEILNTNHNYTHIIDLSHNINLKALRIDTPDQIVDLTNNINLEEVICTYNYDEIIDVSHLINLKKLILFGLDFNNAIDISNCVLLEELRLGQTFNLPLDLTNNVNLKILRLESSFNQPIDLSNNIKLEHIGFGYNFNHPINIDNLIDLKVLKMDSFDFEYPLRITNNINLTHISFLGRYQHVNELSAQAPALQISVANRVRIFIEYGVSQSTMTDEEFMNSMMHSKYIKNETVRVYDDTCSICKDDYINEDNITFLPCSELNKEVNMNHHFHTDCIKDWTIQQNASCPICRTQLN